MLDALKQMLTSKKWLAVLVAIVLQVLAQFHVITPDIANTIGVILGIGVAGQSIADHGKEAAKINASAPPKQGGFIIRTLVLWMALVGVLAMLMNACGPTGQMLRHDAATCAKQEAKVATASLLPAVEAALMGDAPNWRQQLDALLALAGDAGACTVSTAFADLTSAHDAQPGDAHASSQEDVGARNASMYMAEKGW